MTYARLWMATLLLIAGSALAETRPYALEVLIFSRPGPVHSIDEVFPSEAPKAPDAIDLLFATESRFRNMVPLPGSSFVLQNAARRIESELRGHILFHQRWIHPLTQGQQNNPWFRVTGLGPNGMTLDGYLRWSIDRFIELDADLRVSRPGLRFDRDGEPLDTLYLLDEFRKMSSKDIHYLDHPAFGMIIAAEPIELLQDPEVLGQ